MVVFASVISIKVYTSQQEIRLSDLVLENVEALANNSEIVNNCQGCASYYLGRKCCTLIWPGHLQTITLYHNYN